MALWPTRSEIDQRIGLPQGSPDGDLVDDALEAAIEWIGSRTGYATTSDTVIPSPVRTATMIYARKFYGRKNTPDGIVGGDDLVTLRTNRFDGDAENLLIPWLEVPHA